MYWSDYYNKETRFMMCDECGHRMLKVKDKYGFWDGATYYCPNCSGQSDEDDEDDESGCAACGNPAYPECKSGCPLFDD